MRYILFALLLLGAPVVAQTSALRPPPPTERSTVRTTLPIHPHRHGLMPDYQQSGPFYTLPVTQSDQLSDIHVMRGVIMWHPPDQANFYQYDRPFLPLIQF